MARARARPSSSVAIAGGFGPRRRKTCPGARHRLNHLGPHHAEAIVACSITASARSVPRSSAIPYRTRLLRLRAEQRCPAGTAYTPSPRRGVGAPNARSVPCCGPTSNCSGVRRRRHSSSVRGRRSRPAAGPPCPSRRSTPGSTLPLFAVAPRAHRARLGPRLRRTSLDSRSQSAYRRLKPSSLPTCRRWNR
jgi:hypothetical protein